MKHRRLHGLKFLENSKAVEEWTEHLSYCWRDLHPSDASNRWTDPTTPMVCSSKTWRHHQPKAGMVTSSCFRSRSLFRLCSLFLTVLLAAGGNAHAGRQNEEAIADSVRLALSNAIADTRPPRPIFRNALERVRYQMWLTEMSARLKKRLPDEMSRTEFLEATWYEATRAGLDPGLVLGLIQVESAYRKYAVSIAGARGYMQVMPFWTRVIGDSDPRKLFHMPTNLRYGCAILRMYIDMERGNLYLALGRYNGSRGKPQYAKAVLASGKEWAFDPVQVKKR